MQLGSIGANMSVINDVLPALVPAIAEANGLDGVISMFDAMGGVAWPGRPVRSSQVHLPRCKYSKFHTQ